ncbi:MAG: pyridoxamine 5'-phosphate oxidase family protein [Comamonadaceae bacterium]|nr:MAG: pyridoxamine 5'-phosphate oxidase family protein [Comamonadaceae bacterium]
MTAPDFHTIADLASLDALFDVPGDASLKKESSFLHPVYRQWIEASPFAVLATTGPDGLDASPRGDPASLVTVQDAHTLLLPERRGNNRIDSLRNIVTNPRVALLFLIPGIGETLRVNGCARISVAPELLLRTAMKGTPPKCVIVIAIDSVFFQCARAMQRSGLWTTPDAAALDSVPTAGAMLAALTDSAIDGAAYDSALPARQSATLY